ncbi:MAG: radical SAM protein [Desulfobacteraceae bacterium]|nr:MAG: radical SAM protein [Desulfobacteraceae bacterium]
MLHLQNRELIEETTPLKIVFVRLPFYSLFGVTAVNMRTYPLNLLGLATYVRKKGYEAGIVDGEIIPLQKQAGPGLVRTDPSEEVSRGIRKMIEIIEDADHFLWDDLEKRVLREKPDMVGITCNSVGMEGARHLARRLKPHGIPILLGGSHPTALPEQSLLYTGADIAVLGEGEKPLIHVMNAMSGKGALEKSPSIAWNRGGRIGRTRGRDLIRNLDELPIADRGLLSRSDYFGEVIMTGRGCPYGCTFCASKTIWGKRVRLRSVSSILEELALLSGEGASRLGRAVVKIIDDTFTIDRSRTIRLLDAIVSEGLTKFEFTAAVRADSMDPKLALAMRKANVKRVTLGVESGSPKILQMIRKGETGAGIARGIRFLKDAGIWTHAFFMTGFPGETIADVELSKRFIIETEPDHVEVNMVTPYPGTELFRTLFPDETGIDRWYRWFHQGLSTHSARLGFDLDQVYSDFSSFAAQYNRSRQKDPG